MGSPKVTEGQPKSFVVWYKYRRVRGKKGDFFPNRFVRVRCKKNYFLLHKEITSFLLEKALWKVSNVVLWIC